MQRRTLIVLLAAHVLASSAVARGPFHQDPHQGRKLLQGAGIAYCPDGCEDGYCQQAGTPGALVCVKCKGNLLVDKATGQCACPRGKYSTGATTCQDCPKASYCEGGIYSLANPPVAVSCPTDMTTAGLRSFSVRACVNQAGYFYNTDGKGGVSVTLCPENTYGPGLKKQRACVPCPSGFTTNGKTGSISANACVVPPGYYLKMPGVALPCPKGEYKVGIGSDASCTKCPAGVTTAAEGTTAAKECKIVTAGYYGSAFNADGSVNTTTICPQGYYCPGGNQTQSQAAAGRRLTQTTSTGVIQCPYGAWTKDPGASAVEQCLTPPGFYTDPVALTTQICPDHSYRTDWLPPTQAEAQQCIACGTGVKAEKTDRVVQFLPNGTEVQISVTSSTDDCYIQLGQGLYFETISKTWRAKNCLTNTYGYTNKTFGLQATPCRDCPDGTEANTKYSKSAPFYKTNADGTGGFVSEMACVTKPGYGMVGRGAQKCEAGTYNPGNNYDACTKCAFGYTTLGAGVGLTAADCVTDLGYGVKNGIMGQCPIGWYGDEKIKNASNACKQCPTGRTTTSPGSDSLNDCQLCSPGYGGLNCADLCGGPGSSATYGPAGRTMLTGQPTPCTPCSTDGKTATYSFTYNMANDAFTPKTVARIGAASPIECLSEYSQINDGTFYLPLSSDDGVTVVKNVPDFTKCTEECDKAQCQLVTYDYTEQKCYVRVSVAPYYEGEPWLALKLLPAGYVGTSPWSVKENGGDVKPRSISTGMYAFYQEKQARAVGIVDENVPNRNTFTSVRDCLQACDDAGSSCAGVTVLSTVEPVDIGKTCAFVRSNNNNGVFKRTMIRADLDRLIFPSPFLCPSGYVQDGTGNAPCTPTTVPAVVQLFMRATNPGGCTSDLISSVRTALLNFMQDPNSAFGVYAPGVFVTVGCHVVPFGQGGRRLQQTVDDPLQVDLYATITLSGPTSAGNELLNTCQTTSQCTAGTPATVTGGAVIPGSVEQIPDASVELVATPYTTGEPYYFTATYKSGDTPTAASVFLTSSPGDVFACKTLSASNGVSNFECRPLLAIVGDVTVTVNGPSGDLNVNTVVTASVTVTNTTCLKGSLVKAAGVCEPCERGFWAAAGASSCTQCNTGFTTRDRFSFNDTQCTLCEAGREKADCTKCVKGTFRAGNATASADLLCAACPTGQTTGGTDGTGQTSCTQCVDGYAGPSCSACPRGQYRAGEGPKNSSTVCDVCATGKTTLTTASTANADCNRCIDGFGADGGTDCSECQVGFYAAEAAVTNSTCTACPTGFTTAGNRSTSITQCTVCQAGYGYTDANNKTQCLQCPKGTYSAGGPVGSTQCTPCGAGKTTSAAGKAAAADCSFCVAGFGGGSCTVCAIGTYNAESAVGNNCTACGTGYTTSGTGGTSVSACTVCVAGYGTWDGSSCTICPVGYSGAGGAANCTACTGNTDTLTAGQSTCNACKPGYYGASCDLCPVNTYATGQLKSVATCTSCGTNKVSPVGSDASSDCVCATGYYGASCTTCDVGYWQINSTQPCTACPAGTTTDGAEKEGADAAAACTKCVAGYGGTGTGSTCTQCTANTYNDGSIAGRGACLACQNSGIAVAGSSSCTCTGGQSTVDCS